MIDLSSLVELFDSPADPIELRIERDAAWVSLQGGPLGERFRVEVVERLTSERAAVLSDRASLWSEPLLVVFARSSPDAREQLRRAGVAFLGTDGRLFISTPQLYIDRPPTHKARDVAARSGVAASERSPFAKRASRVTRWLLLNPERRPTVAELTAGTKLSQAFTSQVVAALDTAGLVAARPDPADARRKRIDVPSPGRLMDAWARAWDRRRIQRWSWDIGAATVGDVEAEWAQASRQVPNARWALGGVAGAVRLRRAVEPASVLVWIDANDADRWRDLLVPREVSRGMTRLRVALADDPYIFELVDHQHDLPICDPAQLYLDCLQEGERALEQADAIRAVRGW